MNKLILKYMDFFRRHNRQQYGPILLIMLTVLLLKPALGQTNSVGRRPLKVEFQAVLDSLRTEYGFPGATAAYSLPDGTVEVFATGLADVEAKIPMTPQSRMLAASIGKMFVAATAVALVEEGILDLDAPASKWLGQRSWFARLPNHETMTLRHLLTHSSGIPNHVETAGFTQAFCENRSAATNPIPPEALISFVLDQPAVFPAGQGWYYSDTGYLLVGLIIEAATGHRYYEEVTQRFLVPLQLTLTSPSNRIDLPGLAAGYMAQVNGFSLPEKTTTRPGVMAWHPGIEWTGGGLVSNPKDLVIWAKALFCDDETVTPGQKILLQSVAVGTDSTGVRYGMGIGIHEKGPLGPNYGHGGWIPGYSSSLRYYPETDIAVAFQINTDIGIVDHATPLIEDMETRLARRVISTLAK